MSALTLVLVAVVMLGALAPVVGAWQYLLIGLHAVRNHLRATRPYLPRTAALIPAWNAGAVIGASIDRLLGMDYPHGATAGAPRAHQGGWQGQGPCAQPGTGAGTLR
ncbi:MAG: hypothetical protein LH650_10140 [Chloroflexi bacterium]|nr:hypothetical protein [Chloroflexota bacterium]